MEAGYGIDLQQPNGDLEKASETDGPCPNADKGNEDPLVELSGAPGDSSNVEDLDSSEIGDGIPVGLPEIRTSKKQGSEKKGQLGRNGPATISGMKSAGLSKSHSFASKGAAANGLKKNTTDLRRLKPRTKGVASPESNELLSPKQTDLDSTPAILPSLDSNSSSGDITASGDASDTSQGTIPQVASQRKSSGSGFSFRLDERAQKRKEFFEKLEEKIQAKEVEKTNLEAKSKENQEAEIKLLRKSLTFKAMPMPSFYKEPGPPKLELKKIPTTRPISPKLGRHKPSTEAAETSPEVGAPSRSSRPGTEPTKSNGGVSNGNDDAMGSKKPNQKSPAKLPSHGSTVTRPGRKATGTEPKLSNPKNDPAKVNVEVGENLSKVPEGVPQRQLTVLGWTPCNDTQDGKSEGDGAVVSLPNPELITPSEASVKG